MWPPPDGCRFWPGCCSTDALLDTRSYEQLDRDLYPAQTWTSMNSGVPHADHGVYWYGDPKPSRYPFYWQMAAAAGRSVGLVNTLHSSPMAERCAGPGYEFVLPDCFGTDPTTLPSKYTGFQRVNLQLTRANSRKAGLRPGVRQLAGLMRSLPGLGLRASTLAELTSLISGVAGGGVPRERLRSGQFLILRDLFFLSGGGQAARPGRVLHQSRRRRHASVLVCHVSGRLRTRAL